MAKTTKVKKGSRPPSIHSRASRRATSPSIDTDKSLKTVAPPPDSKSFYAVHTAAGIKKKNGKQMSRSKRLRREKGQQRAEAVLDQLEKKVDRSSRQAKNTKERSHDWDNINEKLGDPGKNNPLSKREGQDVDSTNDDMEDIEGNNNPMAPDLDMPALVTAAPGVDDDDEDVVL